METTQTKEPRAAQGAPVTPLADIFETETAFGILLNMPGIDEEEVEISLEKRVLTVESKSESRGKYFYRRSFRLNESVDPLEIGATLQQGVLELVLPKSPESKRKIISISTH